MYPDETGHFYIHHVGNIIVWDTNEIWRPPYLFSFIPAIVQCCFGKIDKNGQEIFTGNVQIMEISPVLFQCSIWQACLSS